MIEHPTRRDVVIGGAALTLSAGNTAADPAPAAVAKGTISEANGAPIPDALVSNGRDVVRSDAGGRYSLPVEPGQVIFVIKPSGFRVPVDPATNLPKISYVHDPDGTPPGFRYRGLAPTGPLPASIDFTLTREPEPPAFDVILFTDPQPESTAEIEFVRDDVVAGLVGAKAAFGITCGDIAFDDLSMYGRINRIIGCIGLPWWNVGGNHDLDYEAPNAKRSRDTYKRVFGAPAYAHAYGNALFVMLDNVEYLGAGTGKPGERNGAYRGAISTDQLAFVEALLRETPKDRLIVLVMHIPLRTYIEPNEPASNTANARDLLKLVGDRPCVSFAGHTHSTEHHYLGPDEGFDGPQHHHHVLTAVSGAWWSGPTDHRGIASADSYDGTPNGYHVLSIDGAAYTTRYVPAAEPGRRQMRITLDSQFRQDDRQVQRELSMIEVLASPITAEQAAGTYLVVNLFDGGPKSTVAFAIDGGAATPMTKVRRSDPFIEQVYGRHPETIKKWVKPQISSHIWQAPLPAGLAPGAYAIEVHAVDEYARAHVDGMILEIV